MGRQKPVPGAGKVHEREARYMDLLASSGSSTSFHRNFLAQLYAIDYLHMPLGMILIGCLLSPSRYNLVWFPTWNLFFRRTPTARPAGLGGATKKFSATSWSMVGRTFGAEAGSHHSKTRPMLGVY